MILRPKSDVRLGKCNRNKELRTDVMMTRDLGDIFLLFTQILRVCLLYVTVCDPCTVVRQAPLSMQILQARILKCATCPPPGILPKPEIKPSSPVLQAHSLPSESPDLG